MRFLGPVGEQALPDLYRRAVVLVLPSVARTCYGRTVRVSELLGLAGKIVVLRHGELVGEVPAAEATEEGLLALASTGRTSGAA